MHRTQIMLDKPQYDFLMEQARRHGTSMAAVIRRLIVEQMDQEVPVDDPLEDIIGIAHGGAPVAESDHDHIIYGTDRP
ncbi:MAG TPA: hypothetical protein PKA13_24095 [Geminicoccaceae bacterium]|nr:hypothetical protein [Geminicoccus sp.]HMU52879.1 hypothetical protein [Geminicoccaceae bacterium]